MAQPKIRFICHAVRWRDRVNGNTYHSVAVTRVRDGKTLHVGMQYGYGDHYRQTALGALAVARWIPPAYRTHETRWRYERENNYPIQWIVSDGLQRECIANGRP
jgi:hypothetical protein